jgi:hypothetical protein
MFGTLLTNPENAQAERAAGVGIAHLELTWDRYEPRDGVFDATYAATMKARLDTLHAAGMRVVLGVGLQYPPNWMYDLPNSRYVNQFGVAGGPPNLTFNQTLRDRAATYIARVAQDFDLNNFDAVRIGSGGYVETLYPAADDGQGHTNSYWAFDANAQRGNERPASIPAPPLAGWTPGQRSYSDQSVTPNQVDAWYQWYVGALVDGVRWQLNTYRGLGFRGQLQVLMPGVGTLPRYYQDGINTYLDGSADSSRTMSRGAVWDRVVTLLAQEPQVVVYVSSVADGSGGDDLCTPSDVAVSPTDPAVQHWSATRWLSYLAGRANLPKSGENVGQADSRLSYGRELMQRAILQAKSCGFGNLMWAHDFDLFANANAVSLDDYRRFIESSPPL